MKIHDINTYNCDYNKEKHSVHITNVNTQYNFTVIVINRYSYSKFRFNYHINSSGHFTRIFP